MLTIKLITFIFSEGENENGEKNSESNSSNNLDTEEKQMDNLRRMFKQLLGLLDIKEEGDSPEQACRRILHNIGEGAVGDSDVPMDLETFRINVSNFLRLMVRSEVLDSITGHSTVDGTLEELLQNPQELQCGE